MNQPAIMGILQSRGSLLDIGHDAYRRERNSPGVALAQGAIGGIIHHQKRDIILHAKVQHTHDIGMHQAGDSSCFIAELLQATSC